MDSRLSRTITEWPCKQLPVTVVVFIALILSPLSRCNPIGSCPQEQVSVKNQPFKSRIIESCDHRLNILSANEEQLRNFRNLNLKNVLFNIREQRNVAETIINQTRQDICSSAEFGNLSNTPTIDSIEGLDNATALLKLHLSLLEHAVNIYYTEQHLAPDCERRNVSIIDETNVLAAQILQIACNIQNVIKTMSHASDFVQILNDAIDTCLMKHASCAKRELHACQTIQSSYKLLQTISDYIVDNFVMDPET